ncbi:UPAR/Ly6 domain-containing protein cold [Epargyreus clarus]|uniref:UPAR/Ly6 domain-containing protein cold n=1 Tax=Epargyreus clarus TaxID=520877 RepID=UPI003C2E6A4C
MRRNYIIGIISTVVLASIVRVIGLECYVCENQEDNNEKCVKTIKTCDYNQDVCLTEIKWGSTPYWSQGAKKQYYISKRCSNKTECATTRLRYMPLCTHIWYQDWVCSDCCMGDRCNYYIISESSSAKPVIGLLLGGAFLLWILGFK